MKTLILIDLQRYFFDDLSDEEEKILLDRVVRISKVFMANSWPIIVVKFTDWARKNNDLSPAIEDLLKYKNTYFVEKDCCDGSIQILDTIDINRLPLHVVVAGLFTDQCVSQTINGLIERDKYIRIVVLRDCIWPNEGHLMIEEEYDDKVDIWDQEKLLCTSDIRPLLGNKHRSRIRNRDRV